MDQSGNTLDPVRTWVATRVRRAVTGRNGGVRHRDLFGSGGERWFDEDAVIRRVHADSAMFVGGLRALLLQSLHPLAMAGVADHSDYRTDPWHRLQRTADFLAATTYGPTAEAERAVARVHAVHEGVVGVAPDGRSYAANDPHLLRWVHVAEVDSFLVAHQRYGEIALDPGERDEYVREMAVIAARSACPHRPNPSARCRTTRSVPSVPSFEAHRPRARRPATCCCNRRCTPRCARCTRCSARLRWRCCRDGHGGRCGCRHSRSWKRSPCDRRATRSVRGLRWALSGTPMPDADHDPTVGAGDEADLTA